MDKKYESPEITVVSMEPDESLMGDFGGGVGEEGGYGLLSNGVAKVPWATE